MQSLTTRNKQVERKPMSFLERLYLWNIAKGMAITFSHLFKKKPTINYPEQKRTFAAVFRGIQILNRDEEGRERCTACGLCAVACPAEAITMEGAERQPGEEHLYKEKSMQPSTRSICCAVFFVACAKKPVQKTRFI
jgi:NADH-quinone oxidoreductase subunit I